MNGFLDATRFPEIKELCIKAEMKQFKNAKHLDSGLGPALDKRPKFCADIKNQGQTMNIY